jgi:hypothetical protein
MRGARIAIGIFLGIVALVGFAALFEHFASIKDDAWLKNIFAFEIATYPTWLSLVSVGALIGSVLLLRIAKA